MEIFVGIIATLILLIITLLLLPVHIFIKKDKEDGFSFKIKVLFFELCNDGSEDSKTAYNIKKVFGLDKKHSDEKNAKEKKESFTEKATRYSALISDIFNAATSVIRKITVKKLHLDIVCAEEDAADTAISYGRCCAIVLPVVSAINSFTNVKQDGERVNISCDYTSERGRFDFDIHFYVRLFALLSALLKFGFNRAKRGANTQKKSKK